MIKRLISSNQLNPDVRAAAPIYGAAAFCHSTRFKGIPQEASSRFCEHQPMKTDELNNLLPEKHYFRRELAKWPVRIVVIVEGQFSATSSEGIA